MVKNSFQLSENSFQKTCVERKLKKFRFEKGWVVGGIGMVGFALSTPAGEVRRQNKR